MILNLTKKPLVAFNAMQRLALHGEELVTPMKSITYIDDFYPLLDTYENVLTKVIVDPENFILANDIINAVDCPVVTLDIESVVDTGTWEFVAYNPYENE